MSSSFADFLKKNHRTQEHQKNSIERVETPNNIEGAVTEICEELLHFTLDGKYIVHISLFILHISLYSLPKKNEFVKISNYNLFKIENESHIVLCDKSEMLGGFTGNKLPEDNSFLNFVNIYKLNVNDIITFHTLRKFIEKQSELTKIAEKTDIVVNILKYILTKHNNVIPHFTLKSVGQSHCVNITFGDENLKVFPHWFYGYHPSDKNEMLFGFLKIHKYGYLYLKESNDQIAVYLLNKANENLSEYINKYVVIENYKIFTEIYNDTSVNNLEYIIVDIKDIFPVFSLENFNNSYLKDNTPEEVFKKRMQILVVSVSEVMIDTNSKKPQYWLQVKTTGKSAEDAFIYLNEKYISIKPYFAVGRKYTIHFNDPLQPKSNIELLRIYPKYKQYEIKDPIFVQNEYEVAENQLMNTKEVKQHISQNSSLVSFQGKLQSKRFNDPLPSRTKFEKINEFGTSGNKAHHLVFHIEDRKFFDLYINNWENIINPIGLLPNMVVAVYNVQPQSKKYLKCTALTKFQVIAYDPPVEFNTAKLYCDVFGLQDWGKPYYLSKGINVPYGVLLWCEVTNIKITNLKLTKIEEGPQCKNQVNLTLNIFASDLFGMSKIIIKNIDFLKIILDLQDTQFQFWLSTFIEHIEDFSYHNKEEEPVTEKDYFISQLNQLITNFNLWNFVKLNVMCRKFDKKDPLEDYEAPLYVLVDFRVCENWNVVQ